MAIQTNFFDYLFEKEYFKYLVEEKANITLSGSHALAFWAAQNNLPFRDVSKSDIDIRCFDYQKTVEELRIWTDPERIFYDKYLKENNLFDIWLRTERDLKYEESLEVGTLINLKARLMEDDNQWEYPVMDLFCFDKKQNNRFEWVQNGEYNFRVLSLQACLEHKQIMFDATKKEKHKEDLALFKNIS